MAAKLLIPILFSLFAFAFGLAGRVYQRGGRLVTILGQSGLNDSENDALNLRELLQVSLYWAYFFYAAAWLREIRSAWQHHPLLTTLLMFLVAVIISTVAPSTARES
jgi:hypothetical protein